MNTALRIGHDYIQKRRHTKEILRPNILRCHELDTPMNLREGKSNIEAVIKLMHNAANFLD